MSSYKILNPDGVELEHDAFVRDLLKILGSGAVPFIDLSDDISTLVIKSAEDQSFTIETELGEEVIKVDTNAKTFELVAPYSAVGFSGGGDMLKSVYDTGDNGVVDNSENLEGNNSAYHLDRSNHSGAEDLEDKVAMSGDITIAINGNLDDWNPTGLSTASVIRLNPSASYTITGLQGGEDGRLIIIHNTSSVHAVRFFPESGSSAAANRFTNGITIGANASFGLQYDSTISRWRVLYATSDGAQLYSHEYGEFYFKDNTSETALTLNTPVKIGGGTYSNGDSSTAMTVATGRVTYTGLENIQVACHATVTANNIDGGSPDYVFYIAKNGLVIGKSAAERDIGAAEASIGFQCLTDMSQNDYIECWVENVTDNDDIVVQDINCFIHTV